MRGLHNVRHLSKRHGLTKPTHSARHTCWKSRSTSWVSGLSPSAPETRRSSNQDSATARATEHEMIEDQRILQACSARRRSDHPSWRAFGLASRPTNCLASSDHRPATSIPRTTSRARARGPTSSGYLSLSDVLLRSKQRRQLQQHP